MKLREALASMPGERTLEVARAWVDAMVEVPDPTALDTRALMARLSNEDSAVVFGTLRAAADQNPLVYEALLKLRGEGLDLSHENARQMIDLLFDEELAAKVKALAVKTVPRSEALGLGRVKDGHILEALQWEP